MLYFQDDLKSVSMISADTLLKLSNMCWVYLQLELIKMEIVVMN